MGGLSGNRTVIAAMLAAFAATGTSAAFHDLETFVRAPDLVQWSVIPAQGVRSLLAGGKDEATEFAPADHPATKRLQYWVDLMHGMVLQKYPAQLGSVLAVGSSVHSKPRHGLY